MVSTSLTGDVAAIQQVQLLQLRCARRPRPRSERDSQRVQARCATGPSCAADAPAWLNTWKTRSIWLAWNHLEIGYHIMSHLCSQQNSHSRAESWDVFAKALWGKHLLQHAATDTVASEHLSDAVELEEKCSSQSSK